MVISPAGINKNNSAFWKKHEAELQTRAVFEIALLIHHLEEQKLKKTLTKMEKKILQKYSLSFDELLEIALEVYKKIQKITANKNRTSAKEIITDWFKNDPSLHNGSASELWDKLKDELKQKFQDFREKKHTKELNKHAYSFQNGTGKKLTIKYKNFSNIIAEIKIPNPANGIFDK